jgi:hypothetical protein
MMVFILGPFRVVCPKTTAVANVIAKKLNNEDLNSLTITFSV